MLRKNAQYTVEILDTTIEGTGIARIDGQVVFVAGALTGETCLVQVQHIGKNAAYAKLLQVLTASAHRIPSDCSYSKTCGGCALRHMDYAQECEIKQQHVLNCLRRIGAQEISSVPMNGAAELFGYRNKVQFPVQEQNGQAVAGFFAAGTHTVTAVEDCRIQPSCAERIRAAVLAWMRQYHIRAYEEATHTGFIRHIYIRQGAVSKQILVCIVANTQMLPQKKKLVSMLLAAEPSITTIVFSPNTKKGNVVLGTSFIPLYGDGFLEDTLCGLQFRLSAPAFYQVNHDQAERLYEKAVSYAQLSGTETVLDLYCGTGTITLCLARHAKQVIGVEVVPQAIEDAKENAARNQISNATFFCMDAGEAAAMFCKQTIKPDVIVVDPPRKGLSPDVIDAMVNMSPMRIVYVSCDPATLARDLKLFCERGYVLKKAEAFDLFPRCAHVETAALLVKSE